MYPLSPMLVMPLKTVVLVDTINENVYTCDGQIYSADDPLVIEIIHNIREEKKEIDAFLSNEEVAEILNTRETELAKAPINA